ncbi:hypothetical protein J3A83DRAFT_4401880 [Scleroderma citrinum]
MSSKAKNLKAEVNALLQFLLTVQSKTRNTSNFPTTVYEAVAAQLTKQFPSKPKTSTNVKYKWTNDRKLMIEYQNTRWLYNPLMHQITPPGGAWGAGTYQGTQATQDINTGLDASFLLYLEDAEQQVAAVQDSILLFSKTMSSTYIYRTQWSSNSNSLNYKFKNHPTRKLPQVNTEVMSPEPIT